MPQLTTCQANVTLARKRKEAAAFLGWNHAPGCAGYPPAIAPGRHTTKQSFCGVTPPQRLGWAEPRPTSWGFRLGRCVRGCDSGEACGWWGDRRAGVTSKIEAARHDGEGCRKGVSGHSVAVIDGERRTSPHSDDGREDQPDKRRICPMAGLSRRRSLLSGDTAKEQEASLLTERTAGGRRTGLRGNSSVGLLG